jgi:probable biosynthetic protein (TIGR04099 family)
MGSIVTLPQSGERRQRLVHAALAPEILIGMPHLTPFGLSETWLLKELAHRHWLMLGLALGLDDADFRDSNGHEVYAAICASAIRAADLGAVSANDILTVRSTMSVVSRTRMSSLHHLAIDGRPIGEVELISAFVHRADGSRNGKVARVLSSNYEALEAPVRHSDLAERSSMIRRGQFEMAGFASPDRQVLDRYVFRPAQLQDFNGAGLFYFANYQSVIDRAFEAWGRESHGGVQRELHFTGNINPYEELTVCRLAGKSANIVIKRSDNIAIAHHRAG